MKSCYSRDRGADNSVNEKMTLENNEHVHKTENSWDVKIMLDSLAKFLVI